MSKVYITKCKNYDAKEVASSLNQLLKNLGGLEQFVKPGNKVLLKVNLLMGVHPDTAVITHPSLVKAVIKEVLRCGGIPLVGDSPGNAAANIKKVWEETQIKKTVEDSGGQMVSFESNIVEIANPSRKSAIKKLHLSKTVFDVDCIISLPKLKTHNFMLFTGAVKNMFGSVPGFYKSRFHLLCPKPDQFAESLIDILQLTKPKLTIIDGIYGMEGHGPSGGTPRHIGFLLASIDPIALDSVCSYLIGYDPKVVPTNKIGVKRGLGISDLSKIAIIGENSLENLRINDYKHSDNVYEITNKIPGFILWLLKPLARKIRVEPVIDPDRCTGCQICKNNCPVDTIRLDGYLNEVRSTKDEVRKTKVCRIIPNKCIMCFCCHELCPDKAIDIKRSWLAKKFGIGYD